jgi:maltose/maltodextrin transport system substrate-binding protein
MMISGPWAWANLIQKGIDFGLSQIPGVNGKVGRPFVGVSAAYLNRSSPNHDLAEEFLEGVYLLPMCRTTPKRPASVRGRATAAK